MSRLQVAIPRSIENLFFPKKKGPFIADIFLKYCKDPKLETPWEVTTVGLSGKFDFFPPPCPLNVAFFFRKPLTLVKKTLSICHCPLAILEKAYAASLRPSASID